VDLGWTGINLPESVGGSGLGIAALIPVVEAMGKGLMGTPLVSTVLAAELIRRAGGVAEEDVLEDISGGCAATVAYLDASDWGGTNCGLLVSDEGVLSGRKFMVPDAAHAQWIAVVGSTSQGDTVVALVSGSDVSAHAQEPHALIDLTKRAATIDFTGIKARRVLAGGKVPSAIRDYLLIGALLTAAESVGSTAACLAGIVDYLKTRKQFGKLIGSFQALKHPTVDIYVAMEQSRSLVYHASSEINEGPLGHEAEVACRMAKAKASETIQFAGDRSVQFHGGFGFTWECDSSLFIRRAAWSQQQFGDAMHHRKRLAPLLLDS
jgi:alkylation response protein AidB-like acyl-CoA dehydrogenase